MRSEELAIKGENFGIYLLCVMFFMAMQELFFKEILSF